MLLNPKHWLWDIIIIHSDMPGPNLEHFLLDFLTFFMASCDNLQEIEYFVYEIYLILSS